MEVVDWVGIPRAHQIGPIDIGVEIQDADTASGIDDGQFGAHGR